jgi:hypothetical protein
MNQIRLTRCSLLPFVFASREEVRAAHEIEVSLRVISSNLIDNVFNADHLQIRRKSKYFDGISITKCVEEEVVRSMTTTKGDARH